MFYTEIKKTNSRTFSEAFIECIYNLKDYRSDIRVYYYKHIWHCLHKYGLNTYIWQFYQNLTVTSGHTDK